MKLRDLRERTKAAHNALLVCRQGLGGGPIGNMRETYRWVEVLAERLIANDPDLTVTSEMRPLIINFYRTGQIYYYAKKHGVEAAMLYRLSSQ